MRARSNTPCPKCGINPRQDCGFGVWASMPNGREFNCDAPDAVDSCDNCHHTWCDECKVAAKTGKKGK